MNLKKLLLGAVAGALFASSAYAQTIGQTTLSGNECWNAGQGPGGGTTGFVCSSLVRNTRAFSVYSGSGAQTVTATNLQSTLYWTGTAPTTWTITTPTIPYDGQLLQISSDTTLTSLVTLTANTGQTLNVAFTSGTVTASTSVLYQYSQATTKWYRLQ